MFAKSLEVKLAVSTGVSMLTGSSLVSFHAISMLTNANIHRRVQSCFPKSSQ